MHFEAKKVIVGGGSAGTGGQVAVDVVDVQSALSERHSDATLLVNAGGWRG